MSNKKLQVFVSSTFEDLKEERQAAVEAILSAGHIPAGMELFTAGDETQMTVIKRWIDESDVYLLILGGRYGSVDKVSGKSYTQLEYEYAVEKEKALFAVIITENALELKLKTGGSKMIEQDNPKELRSFKEEAKTKLVKFWDDRKDIKLAIHETLNDFTYRKELIGWVRGDNAVSGNVAEELARLGKENEELKYTLDESKEKILYAGLNYQELINFLKGNVLTGSEIKYTLYNYLIEYGERFSEEYRIHQDNDRSILKLLTKYNIINSKYFHPFYVYEFTEAGHNFYLKSLALENKENKNQILSS